MLIRGNQSQSIAISAHPDERILDAVDQQPLEDSEVDQVLQRDEHDRREAVLWQVEEDLIGEATSRWSEVLMAIRGYSWMKFI